MRVLICGSRNWSDYGYIENIMHERLKDGDIVIHGAARGADSIAGSIAEEMGLEVIRFPANWKKYGRSAGPVRNQQMLAEGRPDEVWAFTNDLEKSRGTRHMVETARGVGAPTEVFCYEEGG
jgi:hypothetical protein